MKCSNIWQKVGGRKFIVWTVNEIAIIAIGIFVGHKYGGEWGLAVIVGGLLVNGLIYSAANVWIKAKLPGGSEVSLGDGGKNGVGKEEPGEDRDRPGGRPRGGAAG